MVALAQERGIEVVLLGVPRFGLFLSSAEQYRVVAERTGVLFIEDVLSDILTYNSLKADVAHPNNAGYREMAGQSYAALHEAGAVN